MWLYNSLFVTWTTCFDLYRPSSVPSIVCLAHLQCQYCIMASILLFANTQYGTANKPISILIKLLSFHLPAFCCARLSSWIFVPRVGTLSNVLQSAVPTRGTKIHEDNLEQQNAGKWKLKSLISILIGLLAVPYWVLAKSKILAIIQYWHCKWAKQAIEEPDNGL